MGGLPPASCSCDTAPPLHICCASYSSDTRDTPPSSKPSENGNLEFHPPKDFGYDDEEKQNGKTVTESASVAAVVIPQPQGSNIQGIPEVQNSTDLWHPGQNGRLSGGSSGVALRGSSESRDGSRSPSASSTSSPDGSPHKNNRKSKDVDSSTSSMRLRSSLPRNSSHSRSSKLSEEAVVSAGVGSYRSKLQSTPELFTVSSQGLDDTNAGSCFVDDEQGWRPGTPRPSRIEEPQDAAITHSVSRHSVISKGSLCTTLTTGTTKSKSLFAWTDPEQDFKEMRRSVSSRVSHQVFVIPEAKAVEDSSIGIGEISTIPE